MDVMNLDTGGCEPSIRLLVVQRRQLDCDGFVSAARSVPWLQVVWAGTLLGEGLSVCESEQVDVAVFDALLPGNWATERAAALVDSGRVRGILLLDENLDENRKSLTSSRRGFAYITRQAAFSQVFDGIRQLASHQLADDPNRRSWKLDGPHTRQGVFGPQVNSAANGSVRQPALSCLTPRETEVMRLVATGKSVKDCAKMLGLAQSTVDNHKSRLMRKLNIHKSSELTRMAICEGLITA